MPLPSVATDVGTGSSGPWWAAATAGASGWADDASRLAARARDVDAAMLADRLDVGHPRRPSVRVPVLSSASNVIRRASSR
jgi:hypothetical protein